MYGLIVKLTAASGARDTLIQILSESAVDMPGCLSYVVAKDAVDDSVLWVTEVWDNEASHDSSLSLPTVRNAIPRAKPLVLHFEKVAATSPVWAAGLISAHVPSRCVDHAVEK